VRLENRTALITGAAGGIGAATAWRFAREGAAVALNDTATERLDTLAAEIREDGGQVTIVAGDVTRETHVERMVREATESYGRIDILINNAGISHDAMAAPMTEEQWGLVVAAHLRGTFLCAQAVLPGMRERGWGRIVSTSSAAALGTIGQVNDAASTASVIGLTKTLALEYARYGVTVNCVAPGAIMTPMLAGVPDTIVEKIAAQIPMGRIARPEEIAAVHAFLASDDAALITGQVIFADGGTSIGPCGGGGAGQAVQI
jgi:3-oxoacyl-[acyl-carrier protein] reductase